MSPVCSLEDLDAQFDSITKPIGDGRTGESPSHGAMVIPALYAVLITGSCHRTQPHPRLLIGARCKRVYIVT